MGVCVINVNVVNVFRMSESPFWPSVQALDDPGAEEDEELDGGCFGLDNETIKSSLPEDLTARIKAMLQGDGADNPESDEKSPPVTKPLISKANKLRAEIEEAFPLSDRSSFYSKLLRRNRAGGGHQQSPSETQNTSVQESLGTYVALDPSKKNSIAEKQKELLLNPKLMSQLDASMAVDQAHVIEPKMGKRALKKAKKEQREKKEGLGAAWFGMKAPEVTDELKRDLEVLKMRGAIDPKRFYKKTGTQDEGLPKCFQVGHVIDSPADYYSASGGGSGKKKKSLVDELMADAEYQKFSKRKYAEIVEEKAKLDPRNKYKLMKKRKKMEKAAKATSTNG